MSSYAVVSKRNDSRKVVYAILNYLQPLNPADFTWTGKASDVTTASDYFLPSDLAHADIVLVSYSAEDVLLKTNDLAYWSFDPMGTQPMDTWTINEDDELLIKSVNFNADSEEWDNPVIYVKRKLYLSDGFYNKFISGKWVEFEPRLKAMGNFSRKVDFINNASFDMGKSALTLINNDYFFNNLIDSNVFKEQKVEIYSAIFDVNLTPYENKLGEFKIEEVTSGDSEDVVFQLLESNFMTQLTLDTVKVVDEKKETHSLYGVVKDYKREFPAVEAIKTLSFDNEELIYVCQATVTQSFPNPPMIIEIDSQDNFIHFITGTNLVLVDQDGNVYRDRFFEIIDTIGWKSLAIKDPIDSNDVPTGTVFDIYINKSSFFRETIDLDLSNNYAGDDKQFLKSLVTSSGTAGDKFIKVESNMFFLKPDDHIIIKFNNGKSHSGLVKSVELDGSNCKVNLYNQLAYDISVNSASYILVHKIEKYRVQEFIFKNKNSFFTITLPPETDLTTTDFWANSYDYLRIKGDSLSFTNIYMQNSTGTRTAPVLSGITVEIPYADTLAEYITSFLSLNNDVDFSSDWAITQDERFPSQLKIEPNYLINESTAEYDPAYTDKNLVYETGNPGFDGFNIAIDGHGETCVNFDFSNNKLKATLNRIKLGYNNSQKLSFVSGSFLSFPSASDGKDRRRLDSPNLGFIYKVPVTVNDWDGWGNPFRKTIITKQFRTQIGDIFKEVSIGDFIMLSEGQYSEYFRVMEKDNDTTVYLDRAADNFNGVDEIIHIKGEDSGTYNIELGGFLTNPQFNNIVKDIANFTYGITNINQNSLDNISKAFLALNRQGILVEKDEGFYKHLNKLVKPSNIISYFNTSGQLDFKFIDLDNLTSIKTIDYTQIINLNMKTVNNLNSFISLKYDKQTDGSEVENENYSTDTVKALDNIIKIAKNTSLDTALYTKSSADDLAQYLLPKFLQNYKQVEITGTMDFTALTLGDIINISNHPVIDSGAKYIVTEINTNGLSAKITAISFFSPINF